MFGCFKNITCLSSIMGVRLNENNSLAVVNIEPSGVSDSACLLEVLRAKELVAAAAGARWRTLPLSGTFADNTGWSHISCHCCKRITHPVKSNVLARRYEPAWLIPQGTPRVVPPTGVDISSARILPPKWYWFQGTAATFRGDRLRCWVRRPAVRHRPLYAYAVVISFSGWSIRRKPEALSARFLPGGRYWRVGQVRLSWPAGPPGPVADWDIGQDENRSIGVAITVATIDRQ